MSLLASRGRWLTPLILGGVLLAQIVTHLAWLTISAHSGQVAIPWMMNHGRTMFGDILEQHAPGTSVIAALAQRLIPADPVLVTRMLNLIVILALTLLVFAIAQRIAGNLAGISAALIWFWWEPVYGNLLFYFDVVVGLLITVALLAWLILEGRKPGWLAPLVVGLLLGGATLAKQHAWAAVVLFALWLLIYERRRVRVYVAAALVLPLALVLIVALQGNLPNYLYWNWLFNFSGLMPNELPSGAFVLKLTLTDSLIPAFVLLALSRDRRWRLIALLWLAGTAELVPRFDEAHVMTQLPLVCIAGGLTLAALAPTGRLLRQLRTVAAPTLVLAGVLIALLIGWLWLGAAPYFSAPLGRAGIPAYDEFRPLVAALKPISQAGDTLFVLPETDSTPQIHVLSGLLPPGLWIKGWFWYLAAPGVVDQLLSEWQQQPPTDIVYFPDLIAQGQPGIAPLVTFMQAHYHSVEAIPAVVFHGPAVIYRLDAQP